MLTGTAKPPQSISSSSCLSTFEIKHSTNRYAIEKLHERDDHELLPKWKRWLAKLVPMTTILSVGSYYLYFPYRIYCTRESSIKYNETYILAWFFIVAEALVARKIDQLIVFEAPLTMNMSSASCVPPSLADSCCSR